MIYFYSFSILFRCNCFCDWFCMFEGLCARSEELLRFLDSVSVESSHCLVPMMVPAVTGHAQVKWMRIVYGLGWQTITSPATPNLQKELQSKYGVASLARLDSTDTGVQSTEAFTQLCMRPKGARERRMSCWGGTYVEGCWFTLDENVQLKKHLWYAPEYSNWPLLYLKPFWI